MPINSFLYPGAKVTPAYEVANSCRFNDGDSPHMTITPGSNGNTKIFTASFWVKRGNFTGSEQEIISTYSSGSDNTTIRFLDTDALDFVDYQSGSAVLKLVTTRVFRDPSAWYHIVCNIDTNQAVEANRAKIYVNGVQETSFSTNTIPAEDATIKWNSTYAHYIGNNGNSGAYFDGYLAEVCVIDGTAYAASDFGEFDEDSPTIWKPKDVSGLTFGTNGFYLDFEDSANLGNDANGGTDLSETNLAATDQSVDTPSNSFCTINPLVVRIGRTAPTLSEGNLKCVHSDSGGNTPAWGTFLLTAGKWYWEVKVTTGNYSYIGIWQPEYNNGLMDDALNGIVIYRQDGYKQAETAATAATYGDSYTGGSDIVSVAVNCDTGTIWFAKNGTWQASATEAEIEAGTTTNAAYTGKSFSKGIIPSISAYSGATHEYNFGSPPYSISSGNADANGYGNFEYSVPDGFLAVCTKNLGSDGG